MGAAGLFDSAGSFMRKHIEWSKPCAARIAWSTTRRLANECVHLPRYPVNPAQDTTMSIPTVQIFIDGQFVDARASRTIDVINPATQEVIGRVPDGDTADIDAAVRAARRAFESEPWSTTTAQER